MKYLVLYQEMFALEISDIQYIKNIALITFKEVL